MFLVEAAKDLFSSCHQCNVFDLCPVVIALSESILIFIEFQAFDGEELFDQMITRAQVSDLLR